MVKTYSHYQVPRISSLKAKLLLSKQWTQVKASQGKGRGVTYCTIH
jgi:hypothetical protein